MTPLEILIARRAAQLGQGGLTQEEAQRLAREHKVPRGKRKRRKKASKLSVEFEYTVHARDRMAQRGVSREVVEACYRYGDRKDAGYGLVSYQLTREAVSLLSTRNLELAIRVAAFTGVAILVNLKKSPPALVTVIYEGEGTVVKGVKVYTDAEPG